MCKFVVGLLTKKCKLFLGRDTLYTTFIDLTEMKFVLVYKLDNSKIQKLDILKELQTGKQRKIKLE